MKKQMLSMVLIFLVFGCTIAYAALLDFSLIFSKTKEVEVSGVAVTAHAFWPDGSLQSSSCFLGSYIGIERDSKVEFTVRATGVDDPEDLKTMVLWVQGRETKVQMYVYPDEEFTIENQEAFSKTFVADFSGMPLGDYDIGFGLEGEFEKNTLRIAIIPISWKSETYEDYMIFAIHHGDGNTDVTREISSTAIFGGTLANGLKKEQTVVQNGFNNEDNYDQNYSQNSDQDSLEEKAVYYFAQDEIEAIKKIEVPLYAQNGDLLGNYPLGEVEGIVLLGKGNESFYLGIVESGKIVKEFEKKFPDDSKYVLLGEIKYYIIEKPSFTNFALNGNIINYIPGENLVIALGEQKEAN